MRTLSVVLLSVWLMLLGANWAAWITIPPHTLGVLTFLVGLAILLLELFFWGTENHWGRRV
jgi:hypothetical protein